MAKAKQRSQPSAEVIPVLHASCIRLQKLLALCEAEVDTLINDSGTSAVVKARQIQILSRTIQGLQRDWLKYMAMLHPDLPVTPPSKPVRIITDEEIDAMSEQELRELHDYFVRGHDDDNAIEFSFETQGNELASSLEEDLNLNPPLSNNPVENPANNPDSKQVKAKAKS